MATETQTGLSSHVLGVTVTTLACFAGIAIAVVSGAVVGTSPEAATNQLIMGILGALVLIQFPVLRVVGVGINGFGARDYLYVMFMIFVLWLITFVILLTSGVQL